MSLKEYSDAGTALADDNAQPADAAAAPEFQVLELARIVPSLTNPRQHFDPVKLQELAESIRTSGVHQAVLVRPVSEGNLLRLDPDVKPDFEIVSGERRLRASVIAKVPNIPAMIRPLSDAQVLEIQLVENLQRDDLTPLEEANGYDRLVKSTKISKDMIGERIGKSRGYVYARLKLLDLQDEAQQALQKGELDASRALVIARIPDASLQIKALTYATTAQWNGVPSYRAFLSWAQQNVMLRLDAARFKITDASLLPAAGSCKECPKRTGANPDLFADVDSADVCTDPTCFHDKETAHDAKAIALAHERGQRVITGKEAKKVWPYEHSSLEGYKRLDKPDDRLSGNKTLAKALGKDAPTPVLVQSPHNGQLVEVLPADKVTAILKEKGLISPAQARAGREISKAEDARKTLEKFERAWRKAAIVKICDAMNHDTSNGLSIPVVRLASYMLINNLTQDQRMHCCELLGLGKVAQRDALEDHVKTCPEEMAERVLMLLLMQHDMLSLVQYGNGKASESSRIEAVAADFKVDLKAVQATVKEELKPKPIAKGDQAIRYRGPNGETWSGRGLMPKWLTVKLEDGATLADFDTTKSTAKPAAERSAATTPKGKRKATAAEASQGIAAALQQLAPAVRHPPTATGQTVRVVNDMGAMGMLRAKHYEFAGATGRVVAQAGKEWTVVIEQLDGKALKPTQRRNFEPIELEVIESAAPAPSGAVTAAPAFSIGDNVRFKLGLKDAAGKKRKVSGRTGVIEVANEDGSFGVRIGNAFDLVKATASDMELVSAAVKPVKAWPFPTKDQPPGATPESALAAAVGADAIEQ